MNMKKMTGVAVCLLAAAGAYWLGPSVGPRSGRLKRHARFGILLIQSHSVWQLWKDRNASKGPSEA